MASKRTKKKVIAILRAAVRKEKDPKVQRALLAETKALAAMYGDALKYKPPVRKVCPRGHRMYSSNIQWVTRSSGKVMRVCKKCAHMRQAKFRAENPESQLEWRRKQMPTKEEAQALIKGLRAGLTLKQLTTGTTSDKKGSKRNPAWKVCDDMKARNLIRANPAFRKLVEPFIRRKQVRKLGPYFVRALREAAGDAPVRYTILYKAASARRLLLRDLKGKRRAKVIAAVIDRYNLDQSITVYHGPAAGLTNLVMV